MSELNRTLTGYQPRLPGARMNTPVTQTGVPPVAIPVVPNPYGMISAQPHHHFMPHLAYNQLPNVQNRMPLVGAIPPTMPGMYVPVAQVPRAPVLASQMPPGPGVVTPTMDPSRLLEQQRKMEKERNFQLQQQRLKQFTVAGRKGSINAENLIDSMFGKSNTSIKTKPTDYPETKKAAPDTSVQPNSAMTPISFENAFSTPVTANTYPSSIITPSGNSIVNKETKDKKELNAMMMECSNLSGPQKANKSFKPPVKEITPTAYSRSTFATSNKARDWRDTKGLDEAFVEKRPRFPPWCCKEKVPEMYHRIEAIVTENGAHAPETSLLFPILVSSGLPQQTLAQIWEMVNLSAPGYLTAEEMYAALALIAVLQSGHAVKSIDILYHLPSCPVPRLQCFTNPAEAGNVENQPNRLSSDGVSPSSDTQQSSYQIVRPTAISLRKDSFPRLDSASTVDSFSNSSLPPASSTGFISSPDDEFDDFKSATPTCVNFMMHPSSTTNNSPQEDDFDDFKQAPVTATTNVTKANEPIVPVAEMKSSMQEQDLMSPEEDKYSVFRLLQHSENADDWADFSSNSLESSNSVSVPTLTAPEKRLNVQTDTVPDFNSFGTVGKFAFTGDNSFNVKADAKEEDDFGDFLCAETKQDSNVVSLTAEMNKMSTNFADFSNFSDNISTVPTLNVQGNSQIDDDFGKFASSFPVTSKVELGQEFLFRHLKDNISLAESQSVSSLELGTFDGGGHSGESKSSLSRQGSIPSLDLKSTCLEANESEDCFGEFQNAPNRVSSTPSPNNDVKGTEGGNLSGISFGSSFQPPKIVPLIDKYSVIRSEEKKEEDQHISNWTRCLQSSVNILKNTKKIFNQMSCSSVCNEVLSSEEGGNYVKDVIEVYKVACRIKFSSKSYGKQSIAILDLLKEVEQIWNCISGFFAGSSLMPQESSFDFSSSLLRTDIADNTKACGLCLLNVEIKTSKNDDSSLKLSYGGRNYHSTCANFWVNCVDPLLPALTLPQML